MIFAFVIGVMLVAFAVGVPVAYSLLVPSVLYLLAQQVPLYMIPQKMANGVESFPLLAVPFFIAAGELMNTGGVTRRLLTLASTVVGHITGGLAHVAIVANMIMAGMSGSAIADAAGTPRVLIPAMVQERYSKPFAAAILSAAGTIGPIIPPSIASVLYGYIASTSVARLFLGGIIPGVLMGLFLMAAAWGATPTPIPMPEVFTGLQSGIVEGQENPFPQIFSQRFYEVQKYLILTAHITQTGSIIFNERLFQQQSKEHQQALVDSAQEAMDGFLEYLTGQEGKMLEQLKGYGMTAVEPDQAAFREAMKPLYEKYDTIWTKELREKIQAFK